MQLELGQYTLTLEGEPFRMTVRRGDEVVLESAPHPEPLTGLERTQTGARAELGGCRLTFTARPDGFDLRAGPEGAELSLAFEMRGQWFGHGELIHQLLPLNRAMLPESPLLTFDNGFAGQSGKLEPAWYSSLGALVQAHTPVWVGINQPPQTEAYPRYPWSLGEDKGPFAHRPFADPGGVGDGRLAIRGAGLHLSLSFADGARQAYQRLIDSVGHPVETPPAELFVKPTWTTWARYKTQVSQEVVLQFAEEIIQNGFPYGVMEIDDRWQVHYGDLAFDPERFPDPAGMIAALHERGFKVTAWVIPFLDPQSAAFAEGQAGGYLVRQADGTPYLVGWWQGSGALLDVTNPQAVAWFFGNLRRLQAETGLDGFKFDAGEACFFPAGGVTARPITPNEYTQAYVKAVADHYRLAEVRSAWRSQTTPLFFREWDKWSRWGLDNGLHSVLAGILAMGLVGYPFILPDMIGGNAYDHEAPDAELMVRWTQLNALLPAMQFSLAPWDYGDACRALCRQYTELHVKFAERIFELAAETARSGQPLVRPVWWLAPDDGRALACDDEFLLGDELLAAPVVVRGARVRDVYLPPGMWRDYWTGVIYEGARVLKDVPAPLEVLPLFERVGLAN